MSCCSSATGHGLLIIVTHRSWNSIVGIVSNTAGAATGSVIIASSGSAKSISFSVVVVVAEMTEANVRLSVNLERVTFVFDVFWVFLRSGKDVAGSGKFFHGHGWKNISLVNMWFMFNVFVNWNCCVNNMGLNGLPLNNWLNDIVNVVVHMFTDNSSVRVGRLDR